MVRFIYTSEEYGVSFLEERDPDLDKLIEEGLVVRIDIETNGTTMTAISSNGDTAEWVDQ